MRKEQTYPSDRLQQYLKKRKFDILNDPTFKEANSVFLAMFAKITKEGKGAVQRKGHKQDQILGHYTRISI